MRFLFLTFILFSNCKLIFAQDNYDFEIGSIFRDVPYKIEYVDLDSCKKYLALEAIPFYVNENTLTYSTNSVLEPYYSNFKADTCFFNITINYKEKYKYPSLMDSINRPILGATFEYKNRDNAMKDFKTLCKTFGIVEMKQSNKDDIYYSKDIFRKVDGEFVYFKHYLTVYFKKVTRGKKGEFQTYEIGITYQ